MPPPPPPFERPEDDAVPGDRTAPPGSSPALRRAGPIVDAQTVRRVAELAHLALEDEAVPALVAEFERILAAFGTLAEVDVEGVQPLVAPVELPPPARADTVAPSTPRAAFLERAPAASEGFYVLPRSMPDAAPTDASSNDASSNDASSTDNGTEDA